MASQVHSDGRTVTVTTEEGHRIGFAMAELNGPSMLGEITTHWAGGVPPGNPETAVRDAKGEAERHVAQHAPDAPAEAKAARAQGASLGDKLKGALGLP